MSQNSTVLPTTGTLPGLTLVQDINQAIDTLATHFSGPSAPASPVAYQFWADTTAGILKQRNAANNAWIDVCDLSTGEGVALKTHAATSKTTPVDADEIPLADSAASFGLKKLTWNNLKATAKSYFDTIYATLGSLTSKIQPISASVGSNALTGVLNPTILDFRSTTLGSGTVNTRTVGSAISLTVPSGATLGTINAVQSRLALLAIDNSGTVELAIVNISGGNDLTETGVISTTALSGSSNSANVIYSTTARTNVAYRVVGYVESTQATAGTWATNPSTSQGYGGLSLSTLSQKGIWNDVVASRALSTAYYNTRGKDLDIQVTATVGTPNSTIQVAITQNGVTVNIYGSSVSVASLAGYVAASIPPGASYVVTMQGGTTPSLVRWAERY